MSAVFNINAFSSINVLWLCCEHLYSNTLSFPCFFACFSNKEDTSDKMDGKKLFSLSSNSIKYLIKCLLCEVLMFNMFVCSLTNYYAVFINSCVILMSYYVCDCCICQFWECLVCISNRNVIRNLALPLFFKRSSANYRAIL